MTDTIEDLLDTYGDDLDGAIDEHHTERDPARPVALHRRGGTLVFAAACAAITIAGAAILANRTHADEPEPADALAERPAISAESATDEWSRSAIQLSAVVPPHIRCSATPPPPGGCVMRMTDDAPSYEHGVLFEVWLLEAGSIDVDGVVPAEVRRVVATDSAGADHATTTTPIDGWTTARRFEMSFVADVVTEVRFFDADGRLVHEATCGDEGMGWGGWHGEPAEVDRYGAQAEIGNACD